MLGVYVASCFLSMMFSRTGHYYLSGFVLMAAAVGLYVHFYRKEKKLLDFRGLISLAWVGGEGLAALKLSRLGSDWHILTWISFSLFYLCFLVGFRWLGGKKSAEREKAPSGASADRLLFCALFLTVISVACFLLEAAVLGFVPLFSREPHAYSYFHLTGIHYFTVSGILAAPMSVIYFYCEENADRRRVILWAVLDVIAFVIPILCVSRFMVIMGVGMVVLTYVLLNQRIRPGYLLMTGVGMVLVYLFLTVARNHDAAYLNSIFEMKNEKLPLFISQPYIYVAMNFENFNYLVVNLIEHSYGLRELYPFLTLTGIKFFLPGLGGEFPLYLCKEELSTLTLIYDAYYDFHLAGVLGLGLLFGAVCQKTSKVMDRKENPVAALFYVQFAMYALLSFFTTWFSVATTWFWLLLTAVFYVVTGWKPVRVRKKVIIKVAGGAAAVLACVCLSTWAAKGGLPGGTAAEGEFSFGLQLFTDRRTGEGARVQVNWWQSPENGRFYLFLPSDVKLGPVKLKLTGAEEILLDGERVKNGGTVFTWAGTHVIEVPAARESYQVEFMQSQGQYAVFLDREASGISFLDREGSLVYTGRLDSFTEGEGEKPSYEISFAEGENQDWQLIGNADDTTMLQRYLSFDIAYQMGAYELPESVFVDFYADREYQGTYQMLKSVTKELLTPFDMDGLARKYLMEELFYGMETWYTPEEEGQTAMMGNMLYGQNAFHERTVELCRDYLADIVDNEIRVRTDLYAQQLVKSAMMDAYRWNKWPETDSLEGKCQAFLECIGQLNWRLSERLDFLKNALGLQ